MMYIQYISCEYWTLVLDTMGLAKDLFVAMLGLLCLIYVLNPTAGIIEVIPDNIPFIGNLDEATATAVLLASIRYFGIDPANLFTRNAPRRL